jgi:pantothenate kinase type III
MFHHHKTRSSVSQGLALIVVALIDAMSQEMVLTNGARKDVKEKDRLFSSGFTSHSLCYHAQRACRLPWIDQDRSEGGADRPSLS